MQKSFAGEHPPDFLDIFPQISELSSEHLSHFRHFATQGVLPVQELDQSLNLSFSSLGVDLEALATKLEPVYFDPQVRNPGISCGIFAKHNVAEASFGT